MKNSSCGSLLATFLTFVLVCTAFTGTGGLLASSGQLMPPVVSHVIVDESVKDFPQLEPTQGDALHLFSHGKPGQLLLEGEWRDAPAIAEWLSASNRLADKTHLNVYGCEFAKGPEGLAAVHYLETELGVSVAASDDLTGIDGDWELEVGQATEALAFPAYAHNLQGYVDCATVLNNANGFPGFTKVLDGRTYYYTGYGPFGDQVLPTIGTGTPPIGTRTNAYLAVFDENCNQIIGTHAGGSDNSSNAEALFVTPSGDIYVAGITQSTEFPVTDGNPLTTSDRGFYVQRYAPDGTLLYSVVQPYPSGFPSFDDLTVDGDQAYIQLTVSPGQGVPTTDGTTPAGGFDMNIFSLDGSGSLLFSTLLGGSGGEGNTFLTNTSVFASGNYWVTNSTNSTDFPTTDGSTNAGGDDAFLAQYDPAGNLLFSTVFGGSGTERLRRIVADDNFVYIMGSTQSPDFPTTDGTTPSGGEDVFIRKYDLNGNLVYSSVYGGPSDEGRFVFDIIVQNGEVYVLTGVGPDGGFPTTDGTTGDGVAVFKLDANGQVVYSTVLDGEEGTLGINEAGEAFVTLISDGSSVTDGSSSVGTENTTYVKLNVDGSVCAISVVDNGASNRTLGFGLSGAETRICNVQGDTIISTWENTGGALSTDPNNVSDPSVNNLVLTRFVFCPPAPPQPPVTLTPASQEVCQNGLVDQIMGPRQTIDGSIFPTVYKDGVEMDQPDIALNYQWQVSTSPTGPFTDIDEALARRRNYTPPPTGVSLYYRRLTTTSDCCGGEIVSTSEVAELLVTDDAAPLVELPPLSITCPGETFELTPTVTGGTGPFMYAWDTGETTETINPLIAETSVFGVTVTDANGCIQAAQAPIQAYAADAGPDKSICASTPVRLGGTPLPGVQVVPEGSPMAGDYSVAYTWTPATGLSCADCPRPTATSTVETTYTLTVTLYQPDGTTSCQTMDNVTVAVVAAPPTPNFAGEDMVICNGEEAMLGTPADVTLFNPASGTATSGGAVNVAQLNDGDFFNGIRTNDGTSQNIVLDMGSVVTLNQIILATQNSSSFSARNDTDMRIEVSTDNVTYTTLFEDVRPNPFAGTPVTFNSLTTLSFSPRDIRYFRFVPESNSRDASLSEFQAGIGFTYTWAPGEFLRTDGSMATFDPGLVLDDERLLLEPTNPRTYTLSAEFNGCTFVDEVQVALIEARAGDAVKGPTNIGLPDRTPDIEESYTWTRLDAISTGSSMFLGAMDEPQVPVSASFGGPTSYRLETEFTLSTSTAVCVDTVVVTEFCGCNIVFDVENGCADFDTYGEGTITVGLNPDDGLDPDDFDVSWSPMEGLSAFDQRVVTLLDNVTRTYTVTFTNRNDPTLVCTGDIPVNLPSYSRPDFVVTTPVPTCDNDPVNIGDPNENPLLEYSWTPATGLDDAMSSFPLATVTRTTTFTGTAVDPSTGCEATDDVTVQVLGLADGGPDIFVCDNGIVELGTPVQPGFEYSWRPGPAAGGDYRNGTDSTSAQPEVFVAADQQFILTTTELANGCVKMDTVDVFVNPLPPPFTLTSTNFCPSDAPGSLTLGFDNLDAATGTNEVPMDNGTFTYSWSPANFLVDPTVRNPTFSTLPQVETTFTLLLDAGGGCTSEGQVTITPEVTAPVTSGNQTICVDEETTIGSVDNLTGPGITYNWVADAGNPAGATLVTPTDPNPTFSSTEPGTFVYTVTRTENGCSVSASVTIRVQGVTIDPVAGGTVCQGESFQVVNPAQPGLTYSWSPTTGVSDPTISNPVITPPATTTYTLTIINSNGCSEEQQVSIVVSTFPAPELTLMDELICDPADRMFNLMATVTPPSPDYAYSWTPTTFITGDPTTPSPAVTLPDVPDQYTFDLVVTNQVSGCSAEGTVTIDYRNEECMFDLALTKVVADGQSDTITRGDDITFTINVFNQGTVEATNIEITDYIPTGSTYTATGSTPTGNLSTTLGNTAALTNNGDGTFSIDMLAAGDDLSFDITITSDPNTTGDFFNNAEITSADGGIDEDSPLDSVIGEPDDETEVGTDNEISDNSTGGTDLFTDQDDYDPAPFVAVNPSVAVGDTAFLDLNMDGLQTPGEPGVEGVIVTIIDTNTGDTIMVDADGNTITGMDTTDADGFYFFPNLPEGDYTVLFDISEIMDAEFYTFTTPNVGGDDAIDSDATPLSDTTATSTPTGPLADGDEDTTLDVGIACNVSITLAPPATLCSTQSIDLLTGVTVTPDTSATFGATWSTADGTPGMFLDVNGDPVADPAFGTAVSYQPSAADIQRGSVTLVLTTDNPPPTACDAVSEQVTFTILRVDCGSFFWDGARD